MWCFLAVVAHLSQLAFSEEENRMFSYRVTILKDYDFIHQTQIEKKVDKPWIFYFHNPNQQTSLDFIPQFEAIVLEGKDKNYYYCAVDLYENEDVRDRLVVPVLPTMVAFGTDNKMYRYQGELTKEGAYDFVIKEGWRKVEGKAVPKQINYWKRYLRKAFSFKMALFLSVLTGIVISIYMCVRQQRTELIEKITKIEIAQTSIQRKKKQFFKLD